VALEAAGHRSDVRAVALSSDDASLLSASSAAVKVRRSNISGAASWTAAPLLHSKLETCAWHKLVPGMNSACLHSGHTLLTRVVVGRAGVEPAHGRVHSHRGHRLRPVAAVGARQPPRRRRHKGEPRFLYIPHICYRVRSLGRLKGIPGVQAFRSGHTLAFQKCRRCLGELLLPSALQVPAGVSTSPARRNTCLQAHWCRIHVQHCTFAQTLLTPICLYCRRAHWT